MNNRGAGEALMFFAFMFLILIIATAIGIIPNVTDISRSSSMACLLVPIILVNLI